MQNIPVERVDLPAQIIALVAKTATIVGPVARLATRQVDVGRDPVVFLPPVRMDFGRDHLRIGVAERTFDALP